MVTDCVTTKETKNRGQKYCKTFSQDYSLNPSSSNFAT